jgi:phosphatidylglycerol:prolipoprotein diacylglycerol transferase
MLHALAAIQYPPLNPVAFHLGPVQVRWYGLAYLTGFIVAYFWLTRMTRYGKLRISSQALGDLISWLILGVFLGGRLGWWFFYHHNIHNPDERWWEPIAVWHGGMSFHGAFIGVLLVLWIWCRKVKAPLWNVADCAALVTPVGLFFGRIANFINAELVGRTTTVPWGVIFPGDTVPRHPSQLYEALLEGPVLLAILWIAYRWRHPRDGGIASLFVICYGLIRFGVEFTRQPDAQLGYFFGWITMGQILSLIMFLAGIVLWVISQRRTAAVAHDANETAGTR